MLDDLAQLVEDASIAMRGVDLFLGRLPDDVDSGLQIRDYGGRPRENVHTGLTREYPRIQVVSRDPDPEVARQKARAVYELFDGSKRWDQAESTVNGTEYEVIVPLGHLFPLSHDVAGRINIACNYEVRVGTTV